MGILDLIFPKYCVNCKKYGDFLCSNCFSRLSFETKNICLVCGGPSFDGLTHPKCKRKYSVSGTFTAVVYNPISKKLIFQFKYKPYLKSLSSYLGDLIYESLIQDEVFNKVISREIIFVPIPLSSAKMRKRGYNQAEILAKDLAKRLNYICLDCLDRTRDTKSLFKLNKEERRRNIEGAFTLKPKLRTRIKGKRLIIVDDILTSGVTISEAAKVLRKNGAGEVWGLAFAREQ